VAPVPSAATTGNVVVHASGVNSNGSPFTVVPAPSASSVSPSSGAVGASVTINGGNFGSTQGTSTVSFNGTLATPTSWTATSIVAPVPSGASTGNIVVHASGVNSNGVSFTVVPPPSITSLSPASGPVGNSVTITGANFGSTQGTSTISFNGMLATPTGWSATSIVAPVPAGAATGNVVVHASGVNSNGLSFTVLPTPSISSLSPPSGAVGASVTITGTNFGSTQGTSTVTFNGTSATATSWSATSIVATVPSGASTGNVVVTVSGVASNGASFTVLPTPSISSLSPTSGPVGTSVTITGNNFGDTQGTSTLTFNGTSATPTSWSTTSIAAPVPSGASPGSVLVMVNGVVSNGVSFTVMTTPSITNLSPNSGQIGTLVTISGTNFGSTQGTSTVSFNGVNAAPTTWTSTSIVTPVPAGANTGNVLVTVGGVSSDGASFTVTAPPPNISSVSPTSATVGSSVTITGTNFGSTQGTSTVTFNGVPATSTNWSDTLIVVPVPSAAGTGNVVVTVAGVPSNAVALGVPTAALPVIVTQAYDPEYYWDGPSVQKRNIAVGQDGFACFVIDGKDPNTFLDKIWLVRCLDTDCTTHNATLAASGIWRNNGSSLAIGNDGFPRIVYVDNNEILYFIQCTDSDCATSVRSTPLTLDGVCNTGSPDFTPIPGRYCAPGDVNLVMGSNGFAQILFPWQDDYYQDITLSVASCNDDSCTTVTVNDIAQVINESYIFGSIILGPDGYPRITYEGQDPGVESGTTHFVLCTDPACAGKTDTAMGTASSVYSTDVAVGPDGFGVAVFEDADESHIDFLHCTSADCSASDQNSFPVQFSSIYGIFYLGVGADGTSVINVIGGNNVAQRQVVPLMTSDSCLPK
jgi:hypothetical protein